MESHTYNLTHPSNYFLSVATGVIGAGGIPGNVFLSLLILSDYKARKPHEWLLFSLAINDLLLCLNSVLLEAPFITRFDRVECKAAAVFDYAFGTLSFLTPPMVAYNRYLSLYDSARSAKIFTNRNVLLPWMGTILFGFVWVSPFAIIDSVGQDDMGLCGIQIKSLGLAILFLIANSILILSYVVLLFFSYKVIRKIRDHKKSVSQSQVRSRLISESRELIKTMLLISTVPLVAQVPAAMVKSLQVLLPAFEPWFTRLIIAPFPLTSASNAYITWYVIKAYRVKVIKMMKHVNVSVTPVP